jgi:glycosyltransferase involved in cell wall biosynthesis
MLALRSRSKSVLFFNPDYHCSFFLKDELTKRGWMVDISVGNTYPAHLLFREDVKKTRSKVAALDYAIRWLSAIRYRFVVHYGRLSAAGLGYSRVIDRGLLLWCRLLKLLGTHVIYIPSGCRDHVPKGIWKQIDDGNVCGNCGFEPKCSDDDNYRNFSQVRKIAAAAIVGDGHPTSEFAERRIRYKSLDLELFHPNISIPKEHRWESPAKIRVLHSHSLENRNLNGKNIKGTPHVVHAINCLKSEGHDVDLINLSGVHTSTMRFHQVQADIVVDQLIYGGAGSTTLECLALGKPVVCYIRPSWAKFLGDLFPEWQECPIISATPDTLEGELRKLVTDAQYRSQVAIASRQFAERYLDVRKNVLEVEQLLFSL